MELKDILIGKGLSKLHFGITRVEMIKLLGEPDEIEKDDEDEENLIEIFHYDNLELSGSFYEEEGWRLVSLAVSSPNYLFNGLSLIGLDKASVLEKIKEASEVEFVADEYQPEGEDNQLLLSIEELSINLWFEDGLLTELQWGVLWEDDETPIYN